MSFGYSISDFVLLAQLANRAYRNCRKAGDEYVEIATQVRCLYSVIKSLKAEAQREGSSIFNQDSASKTQLAAAANGCKDVLDNLENVLTKYEDIGANIHASISRKLWLRLRFGSKIEELEGIRVKIITHTSTISVILDTIHLSAAERIESKVNDVFEDMHGEFETLRREIYTITSHKKAEARLGAKHSILSLSTYQGDEKAVWQDFRRTLIERGFRSDRLKKHKDILQAYVLKLDESGIWDFDNNHAWAKDKPLQKFPNKQSPNIIPFMKQKITSDTQNENFVSLEGLQHINPLSPAISGKDEKLHHITQTTLTERPKQENLARLCFQGEAREEILIISPKSDKEVEPRTSSPDKMIHGNSETEVSGFISRVKDINLGVDRSCLQHEGSEIEADNLKEQKQHEPKDAHLGDLQVGDLSLVPVLPEERLASVNEQNKTHKPSVCFQIPLKKWWALDNDGKRSTDPTPLGFISSSAIKSILKSPTKNFPEDLSFVGECVTSRENARDRNTHPLDRYTRVSRELISSTLLEFLDIRYHVQGDNFVLSDTSDQKALTIIKGCTKGCVEWAGDDHMQFFSQELLTAAYRSRKYRFQLYKLYRERYPSDVSGHDNATDSEIRKNMLWCMKVKCVDEVAEFVASEKFGEAAYNLYLQLHKSHLKSFCHERPKWAECFAKHGNPDQFLERDERDFRHEFSKYLKDNNLQLGCEDEEVWKNWKKAMVTLFLKKRELEEE